MKPDLATVITNLPINTIREALDRSLLGYHIESSPIGLVVVVLEEKKLNPNQHQGRKWLPVQRLHGRHNRWRWPG